MINAMTDQLAPGFLIAVPQLLDPNFRQSVILLLEQNDDGALGVVVNHESPLRLQELCEDHEMAYSGDPAKRVRRGGPVQPEQGLVLFGDEHDDPEGRTVVNGVQVSASKETLGRLCNEGGERFHCFSGYAGWGPGQLEREISDGSWVTAPIEASLLFDTEPSEMWRECFSSIGIDPAALVASSGEEA